jgi:hypothetical protein
VVAADTAADTALKHANKLRTFNLPSRISDVLGVGLLLGSAAQQQQQ